MPSEKKFDFEAYSGQKPSEPKFLYGEGGNLVPNPRYSEIQNQRAAVFDNLKGFFDQPPRYKLTITDEDPEFREFMKAEQEIRDIKKVADEYGVSTVVARKLLDKIGRAKLFNVDTDDANKRLQRLAKRCFDRDSTRHIDLKLLSHLDSDGEAEAYAEILKELPDYDPGFDSIKSYQPPRQQNLPIPIPLPPTPKQLTSGNNRTPSKPKPEKKTPVVNESLIKNTIDKLEPGQALAFPIDFKYVQKYMNGEGRYLGSEYKIHVVLTSGSKDDVDIVVFQRGIPFKMNHYAATEYNFKDPRKVASAPDHCDVIEMKDGNWNR